jgi:hypothetical protein
MWIHTQKGFLSIIQPPGETDDKFLLVRARVKGDIEAHFPEAKVGFTPHRDYRFRSLIPRIRVRDVIAKTVFSIDYDNYKDSITDRRRREWYSKVWSDMMDMQEIFAEDEDDER